MKVNTKWLTQDWVEANLSGDNLGGEAKQAFRLSLSDEAKLKEIPSRLASAMMRKAIAANIGGIKRNNLASIKNWSQLPKAILAARPAPNEWGPTTINIRLPAKLAKKLDKMQPKTKAQWVRWVVSETLAAFDLDWIEEVRHLGDNVVLVPDTLSFRLPVSVAAKIENVPTGLKSAYFRKAILEGLRSDPDPIDFEEEISHAFSVRVPPEIIAKLPQENLNEWLRCVVSAYVLKNEGGLSFYLR